jgi:hypothetical protein
MFVIFFALGFNDAHPGMIGDSGSEYFLTDWQTTPICVDNGWRVYERLEDSTYHRKNSSNDDRDMHRLCIKKK